MAFALTGIDLWPSNVTATTLVTQDRGDGEKILAMAALGLGSLIFGMAPAVISEQNRRRFPLSISLLLCFGAGILLATAMVHILPEVREQMASNYAEIALCAGFFIIYLIDELIHSCFGEAIQHSHSHTSNTTAQLERSRLQNNGYGAINSQLSESTPLLQERDSPADAAINVHSHEHNSVAIVAESHTNTHCSETAIAEANARICHSSHTEPCERAMTGTLGLFAALTLHSAIEGIAIGVQNTATKVLFLLGAVACHKFVMGFCLGLELRSNPRASIRTQVFGIFVFAMGAVVGIGFGMLLVDLPSNSILPVIQALAGGTLFYVTVCEVIPREKAHWHQNAERKYAGIAQFIAVIIGFTTMTLLTFFIGDD